MVTIHPARKQQQNRRLIVESDAVHIHDITCLYQTLLAVCVVQEEISVVWSQIVAILDCKRLGYDNIEYVLSKYQNTCCSPKKSFF